MNDSAAIRGGNWNNGTQAGLFALNLNNGPSNWNSNIGFRCVAGGTLSSHRSRTFTDARAVAPPLQSP